MSNNLLLINFEKLPEADRDRILKAVDRLADGNPDLPRQLEKLADLKVNNPKQFKLGLKILKL